MVSGMLKKATNSRNSPEPGSHGSARALVGEEQLTPASSAARKFRLVLIKPSHYGDDGYVIRWWRAMIPSNSLAAVFGVAADCAERAVLGPDVAIDITVLDETNTRIDVPALLSRFRQH